MKPDRIPLITKWLLVTVLVLVLLPCLVPAKDTAKLDKQLVEAAARGDAAQVKALLDKGANINAKLNGRTALMQAAWNQHFDVMRLLHKRGADVRAKDHEGNTAWNLLQKARDLEVARQRRELGAQLTLDEAAKRGDLQAVQRPPPDRPDSLGVDLPGRVHDAPAFSSVHTSTYNEIWSLR